MTECNWRPRILFACVGDPRDARYWSGTPYWMHRSLIAAGCDVEVCGPLNQSAKYLSVLPKLGARLRRQEYHWDRAAPLLASFARQIGRRLSRGSFDLVFAPSTIPIAALDCREPIVFWTDAVIDNLVGYYPAPYFSNIDRNALAVSRQQEKSAIERADLCVYSSAWAADCAARCYGVEAERLMVLPFGGNLEPVPSDDDIEDIIDARPQDRCNLLFIGVDWLRKGGPIAVDTLMTLQRRGVAAELTVIGAAELAGTTLPAGVRHLGFVDKNSDDGRALLAAELAGTHFLILPTMADATPIVIGEANAFGIPVLASHTGGIPEMVEEGRNGRTLPLDASGEAYAEQIMADIVNEARYSAFARSARGFYKDKLAWSVNVARLMERMQQLLAS